MMVNALLTFNRAIWALQKIMNLVQDGQKCYMNYKDLIFRIKICYYKYFFSNKFYLPGGEKGLSDGIQPLSGLLVVQVGLNIAQVEEENF